MVHGSYDSYVLPTLRPGIQRLSKVLPSDTTHSLSWVAVKELKVSYNIGETLLFTVYTYYGSLI